MTTAPVTPEPQPEKPQRKRVKIDPANDPGGTLEQLLIANKEAHDAASEAGERESDAKGAIKAYLLDLFQRPEDVPGAIDVAGDPHGRYPGYTMTLKGGKRFDTKRFRSEVGDELYEQFEVDITPSWELRESNPGQRRRKLWLSRSPAMSPRTGTRCSSGRSSRLWSGTTSMTP
jgi:hypothetical protein